MERPKVGVAVFVIKDGKIALGKRKNAHGTESWCLLGGHLEYGESLEECAVRESFEEGGVKIKNIKVGPYTNDIFKEEQKHYITLFLVADYDGGELTVKEPEKCEKWEWFEWNNLPQPLFLPIQNLMKTGWTPFDKK